MKRANGIRLLVSVIVIAGVVAIAAGIVRVRTRHRIEALGPIRLSMLTICEAMNPRSGGGKSLTQGSSHFPRSHRWANCQKRYAYGDVTFSNSTDYLRWLAEYAITRSAYIEPNTIDDWKRLLAAPGVTTFEGNDMSLFTSNSNPFCVVADIEGCEGTADTLPYGFPFIFTRNIVITGLSERAEGRLVDIPPFGDEFGLVAGQYFWKIVTKRTVGRYFAQFDFRNYRVLRPEDTYPQERK